MQPGSQHPPSINAKELLLGLIDIVASGTAVSLQFERLVQKLGIPAGPPAIVFLTGVKRVLRALPDNAYSDNNARIAITEALQTALDAAIDTEDEMNEGVSEGNAS